MGPLAWYVDSTVDILDSDGSWDKPFPNVFEARNAIDLLYPNPVGLLWCRQSGRLLGLIPETLANAFTFVQYVGA